MRKPTGDFHAPTCFVQPAAPTCNDAPRSIPMPSSQHSRAVCASSVDCGILCGLRISFIAGTLGQGGAERQLFYILQAMCAQGTTLRLLSLTRGEFWEERIRVLGVPVVWVGERTSRLARLFRIVKELAPYRPDVVQSSHFFTNPYAVMAARCLGLREIGAVRADVFGEMESNGFLLGRFCLKAPRWLVANSQTGIRNAASEGVSSSRLLFLTNVVDTEQFTPAARQETSIIRLLCVGRLVKQKRVDLFLDVLADVRRVSRVPVEGVVVGEGPLLQSLQERADKLGLLSTGVEFRNSVSNMAAAYREADILVLTSDWEGTPNVVLEASAAGLPIVTTRAGGTPDVVRDCVTGFLCDCGDAEGLVSAVLRLLSDEKLRHGMGEEGRRFVEEHYSSLRLGRFLAEIYPRVLA